MAYQLADTICAIASPPGGAARGIVRLSGPAALDCLSRCFEPWDGPPREARAIPGQVRLPAVASPLPVTLWLWPDARSYTREPCAELHTIGSSPLLEAVVARLCELGARLAGPGEFTLRAFLAGRMDLSQAEAVLGVIEARTPAQLAQALSQLAGGLGRKLAEARSTLLDLLADLEAGLDFAEEDLSFVTRDATLTRLTAARQVVDEQLSQLAGRQTSDLLPRVVLAGPPNAGKSSLFNALTGHAALVSEQAGTTRDYLEARWELDGTACRLIDTAGIEPEHASSDTQRLSRARRDEADLELYCAAADDLAPARESNRPRLLVRTKCDLAPGEPSTRADLSVSAWTGAGLRELGDRVAAHLRDAVTREAGIGSPHCQQALTAARTALEQADAVAREGGAEELLAIELRQALDALGQVVGAVDHDDVLDRLFSRFCIGK